MVWRVYWRRKIHTSLQGNKPFEQNLAETFEQSSEPLVLILLKSSEVDVPQKDLLLIQLSQTPHDTL